MLSLPDAWRRTLLRCSYCAKHIILFYARFCWGVASRRIHNGRHARHATRCPCKCRYMSRVRRVRLNTLCGKWDRERDREQCERFSERDAAEVGTRGCSTANENPARRCVLPTSQRVSVCVEAAEGRADTENDCGGTGTDVYCARLSLLLCFCVCWLCAAKRIYIYTSGARMMVYYRRNCCRPFCLWDICARLVCLYGDIYEHPSELGYICKFSTLGITQMPRHHHPPEYIFISPAARHWYS